MTSHQPSPRSTLAALFLLCLLLGCPFSPRAHEDKESPPPGTGLEEHLGRKLPLDLIFRDESGRQLRLGDLITLPTIILPVYYSCSNVCNLMQGALAAVLPTLQARPVSDYRVLSLSFDERETPELAGKYKKIYLEAMKAPFPEEGWHFLTGEAESIRQLTAAAGYHFQRQGNDYLHPLVSLVVAPDGTIVRYLYGANFLGKDLALALLEAREGKIGITIRKMVNYCFTFDRNNQTYVFNLLRVSATVVIISTGAFLLYLLLTGRKRRPRKTEDSCP